MPRRNWKCGSQGFPTVEIRISHGELMQLWAPGPDSEITGHTLIAIAPRLTEGAACELCQTPIPTAVPCPQCGKPVGLRPATSLGCITVECIVRKWLAVCCPACDYTWDFTSGAPARHVSPPPKEEKKESPAVVAINKAFAMIEQYCAHLATLPLVAGDAQVMKNLEILKAARGKMLEAAAQQEEKQRAHVVKLLTQLQKSRAKKATLDKKVAEMNTPSPPLDGNELAQALLKNVRLVRH